MKRIIVLGGQGFFGSVAVKLLRDAGLKPLSSSRRSSADLRIDVEDSASLREALRKGDVVIDAVGPFQKRSTCLIRTAIEVGFDVIDLSDSLSYAASVHELEGEIGDRIRVLTSSSSVSAVSAALACMSGVADPIRITTLLVPASRYTANPASADSLMRSVGRPIRVLRDGQLIASAGWSESVLFDLPAPIGRARAYLYETANSVTLPRAWPSLRTADFFVDTHVPGLNHLLKLAAKSQVVHAGLTRFQPVGLQLIRSFGLCGGCLAVEVEGSDGRVERHALTAHDGGYHVPVAPAVLAACAIARGAFPHWGVVPPHLHVEASVLIEYLDGLGIKYARLL